MKKINLLISILLLTISTTFYAADADKETKLKECVAIKMVESALNDFTQTVCFTSNSDSKKFNSKFDIDGRIKLIKDQINSILSSDSSVSKKLNRIITRMVPPNQYRINGEYEYTKYACGEVNEERDEALEQVKELIEESCN